MNSSLTVTVLLALAVVVITGRLLGKALVKIGQPPVIGEVLAGILLGPSLLGRLFPARVSTGFRSSRYCSCRKLVGLEWRFAARLGILMNTRGLMELVVLNIGLDLGVLSPRLFTMMVIMAIVTTGMTAPLLDLVTERSPASSSEPARPPRAVAR